MADGSDDPVAAPFPENGIVEALFSRSAMPYAVFDRRGNCIRANQAFARLFGGEAAAFSGCAATELLQGQAPSAAETLQLLQTVISTGAPQRCTARPHRPPGSSGEATYWDWQLEPVFDGSGRLEYVLSTAIDVTELKRAEESQTRLNRALRLLSDCNQTLIHADDEQKLLDDLCRLIVENGGYLMAWVGYAQHDAQKRVQPVAAYGLATDYLSRIRISWATDDMGRGPTGTAIRTGQASVNQDYLANPEMVPWRTAAIERGYQSSISLPLSDGEQAFGALSIYSAEPYSFNPQEVGLLEELADDLAFGIRTLRAHAEGRAAELKLAFLAHHDPLTGLPNRVLLRERFRQALEAAGRNRGLVAMLFMDLDNFKEINDSLGHDVGDELLVRVARRLQERLPDVHTISREGGDEFVVLLCGMSSAADIDRIACDLLDVTRSGFEIGDYTLHITFSIGISMHPDDGADFETLRKNADTALYRAKEEGRNGYRFFTGQMDIDAKARLQMQIDLRAALNEREFTLHFQPQVRLADGSITGMEALLRWRCADGSMIAPGRFIPVAEQCGLIIPISEWVLHEACCQAAAWREAGLPPMGIAVNLSALQFRHGDIAATVASALQRYHLPPAQLELELTESILLQDADGVQATLQALKGIGVKLSIDDFGTGYSSLSYLKRLAVDKLKIDQSFVREMEQDADVLEIVRAIIQLGHILNLEVIAEGVETPAQLELLRGFGCDQMQGYHFSPPVPAAAVPGLFARA